MHSTQVSRQVLAPRPVVYRALVDGDLIARWRAPDGTTGQVHEFDPRPGGAIRISLHHAASGHSHTYRGRFVSLVVDSQVVEALEFEADESRPGLMTVTTTLTDVPGGGTEVCIRHEGLPDSIPAADNETGTRMALDNLARLVEDAPPG